MLHYYGSDAWSLPQAIAVLPLVLSEAQRQAYFPSQPTLRVAMRE
jgi:hypothetical protein